MCNSFPPNHNTTTIVFYCRKANKKKRMNVANKFISKPPDSWEQVLFSDESKFCIFGIKGRKLVWRKNGAALDKQNLFPTVKHGVMVWGCMAANGVGNLVFIDSIMDQRLYVVILKGNLKQSAKKLGLGNDFWFQQDNDPKHTAHNVKLCRISFQSSPSRWKALFSYPHPRFSLVLF